MRGCATVFNDNAVALTNEERYELNQLERLALKYEFTAKQLRHAVEVCRTQESTEGLDEMVAFSFNAQQYTPSYGGGGASLPPGKYKGVIVDTRQEKTTDGKGGYLALDLTPIEGPLAGQKHTDRLNLHNLSAKAVEIANQQMAAYCHVLGVFNVSDTTQLHNIPFYFEVGFQKGQEPTTEKPEGGYTEVKAIFDINGNSPGKAGNGPAPAAAPAAPPAQPPAAAPVAPAPTGWGGEAAAGAPPVAAAPPAPPVAAPAGAPAWGGPPAGAAPAPATAPSAVPPGWG